MFRTKALCVAALLLQTNAHELAKPGSLRKGADGNSDGLLLQDSNEAESKMSSPVSTCSGGGGACGCGNSGDGKLISMSRFYGDKNDQKVYGCGGAFHLSGASWNAQWGGKLTESGPEANALQEAGITFTQSASFDGWEGCCLICGRNLEIAGKISDGWYCEKDWINSGIWLKGKEMHE